jgi:PhnB protein
MPEDKSKNPLRTLTPHLTCANAVEAMEFYKKAFGATEVMKLVSPDGKLMHGCLQIGDSYVMLAEEYPDYNALGPKSLNGTTVSLHLCVDDVDAGMQRAVDAGASITMPAADLFWGDRYGQVEDPFGHRWSLARQIREVSMEEMQEAAKQFVDCPDAAKA